MTYEFHPAAELEHLDTIHYYEFRRPGLGLANLDEFEQAMDRIVGAPQSYQVEMEPDIRRSIMKRFPFFIIFRETSRCIQVLAVAHQRRRPAYWLSRL